MYTGTQCSVLAELTGYVLGRATSTQTAGRENTKLNVQLDKFLH